MQMEDVLKQRLRMIGDIVSSVEIDPEFWNPKNAIWQIPNNHTMLMMRTYYHKNEYDDDFKDSFGKFIDMSVWLYVSFPEWRARIGWTTWFLQLYIVDRQFKREPLPPEYAGRWDPEIWTDPRKWILASDVHPMDVVVERGCNLSLGGDNDDGTSGLADTKPTEDKSG